TFIRKCDAHFNEHEIKRERSGRQHEVAAVRRGSQADEARQDHGRRAEIRRSAENFGGTSAPSRIARKSAGVCRKRINTIKKPFGKASWSPVKHGRYLDWEDA